MSATPPRRPSTSLRRAILTLLAGGAAAQLLPLLLGPWLTRLYSPQAFGVFHLFWAVAGNVAVVACARYEFALPMVVDAAEARALRQLCARLLVGVTALSALGALAWWQLDLAHATEDADGTWRLWLPAAVGALGALSLATLWATRQQCFQALAAARVLQHGGASIAQVFAGLLGFGVHGLIAAPIAAAGLAAARLALAAQGMGNDRGPHEGHDGRHSPPPSAMPAAPDPAPPPTPHWRTLARTYRDFPLLNTPHAFLGALQDTLALAMIAAACGPAAAGFWGLALRYLKAPATLVGSAVSQALYPRLAGADAGLATPDGRRAVVRVMALLAAAALPLVAGLWWLGPWAFERAFGADWHEAGLLARALALYIGAHFVASPLGVVTMAWGAQGWALRLALVGQALFVAAIAAGLAWGRATGGSGLVEAGWAVSLAMAGYFGVYFWRLAHWPLRKVSTD